MHALKYPPLANVLNCVRVCGSCVEVFFVNWSARQTGCIGLRADRFVIQSNHLGQDLTPFYLVMTLGQSQYSKYSNE